jgi:hypothetical protein
MNKLLLLTLFCLIAVVAAQWNNNQQFPNFPTIDCNAPGAVCETSEMTCDGNGNCKKKHSRSGASLVTSANSLLLIGCSLVVAMKMYL